MADVPCVTASGKDNILIRSRNPRLASFKIELREIFVSEL